VEEMININQNHEIEITEVSDHITFVEVNPIEDVIMRNQDRLFRLSLAIMCNKEDAEDIVQDVFVKLIEKAPAFKTEEHEVAWLITVTKNLCKSKLRAASRKNLELTPELLEAYPAQSQNQGELLETVMSLPVKYRVVVHLFYYEGFSTKEIAGITKQREGTVRQQLTRARELLKKYIESEEIS
jgi:RNA polymerase sigma-70 factor (ECF subfamily)